MMIGNIGNGLSVEGLFMNLKSNFKCETVGI